MPGTSDNGEPITNPRSPLATDGGGVRTLVPSRSRLVERHAVTVDRLDPTSPLQIGNGTFAVTVDVTGLQTFPDAYPVAPTGTLLGTQATWAWHRAANPGGYTNDDALRPYVTPQGVVPYLDLSIEEVDGPAMTPAEHWLRANPHRLDLGRVGLYCGHPADVDDVAAIDQVLDLWQGVVRSRFTLAGTRYAVTTAVDPARDAIGVVIAPGEPAWCGIRLRFPYAGDAWGDAADWTRPARHTTNAVRVGAGWRIERTLDDSRYEVLVTGAGLELVETDAHDLALWREASASDPVDIVVEFTAAAGAADRLPSARTVIDRAAQHWQRFWESGAAVELAASDTEHAVELERRVVLSQYLTAVNSSGPLPPCETGLMLNSWRGLSHLEMHALHSAQFALWGRPDVLARQLDWYRTALPGAREVATRQRLTGARWPKQVDPTGTDTPSSIGPFLVWQQPQPILLAELLYRADPGTDALERWRDLVDETAEFMASFATPGDGGFGLGPPIIPAQESYAATRRDARNPTFELAFWAWALGVACLWRDRAGRPVPGRWRAVADGMAPPHRIGGVYAALGTPPHLVRNDHPSMLAALGLLPQTPLIDPAVMARTLDDVRADWDWASTWGWDYPVAAMTATRLGRSVDAVDLLLMDTAKNRYLANGHNRQTSQLPIYLPGNGSLLWAVALMTAGWDGSPATPGFGPGWVVAHDKLLPLP